MLVGKTKRPRNVDSPRAAAILYGDWGSNKASSLDGLCGCSSFWADRRDVFANRAGRSELHGHLPPLSGRAAFTRAFGIVRRSFRSSAPFS